MQNELQIQNPRIFLRFLHILVTQLVQDCECSLVLNECVVNYNCDNVHYCKPGAEVHYNFEVESRGPLPGANTIPYNLPSRARDNFPGPRRYTPLELDPANFSFPRSLIGWLARWSVSGMNFCQTIGKIRMRLPETMTESPLTFWQCLSWCIN